MSFLNIQTMARTLFPQDIPSQRVTVMKDEASNSVILLGNEKNIEKLAEYIRRTRCPRRRCRYAEDVWLYLLENSNVEGYGENLRSHFAPIARYVPWEV